MHGWFTEPVPEYSGDLSEDVCQGPLNECMEVRGSRSTSLCLADEFGTGDSECSARSID